MSGDLGMGHIWWNRTGHTFLSRRPSFEQLLLWKLKKILYIMYAHNDDVGTGFLFDRPL